MFILCGKYFTTKYYILSYRTFYLPIVDQITVVYLDKNKDIK